MPTHKKLKAPPRISKRRGGLRACGNGYTSNPGGCGESMRKVVETLRAYGQEAGIKVCTEPPNEEQAPQGAEGFDTETPNMGDLDRAAAVGGGYYESIYDIMYYATFEGEARKLRDEVYVMPGPYYLQHSKSDATQEAVRNAKRYGAKTCAVVTFKPGKYLNKGLLKVENVEFFPVS